MPVKSFNMKAYDGNGQISFTALLSYDTKSFEFFGYGKDSNYGRISYIHGSFYKNKLIFSKLSTNFNEAVCYYEFDDVVISRTIKCETSYYLAVDKTESNLKNDCILSSIVIKNSKAKTEDIENKFREMFNNFFIDYDLFLFLKPLMRIIKTRKKRTPKS